MRLPRRPKNGFDETTWLRRHGVHVVLRADRWRSIGRRGGLGGIADRLRAALAELDRAGPPRRAARDRRGRRARRRAGALGGAASATSAPPGSTTCSRSRARTSCSSRAARSRWRGCSASRAGSGSSGRSRRSRLRPRRRRAAVGRSAPASPGRSSRWRGSPRGRPTAGTSCLLGALVAARVEPVHAARPRLPALVRRGRGDLRARAAAADDGSRATRCPAQLAGVIAVSTACGLATAPILWLQFHAVPLLAVPANALAAPAVPPLLALAFAAALVGPVSPPAAAAIAWLNGWCAAYLAACARLVGGLPVAQVRSGRARSWPAASLPPWRAPMLGADGRAPLRYLITGTDRPKVTRALRRLRDRVGEDATEHLSAHESSGEDVAAACNALGLFTVERRLVVVEQRRELEGGGREGRPASTSSGRRRRPCSRSSATRSSTTRRWPRRSPRPGEVLVFDLRRAVGAARPTCRSGSSSSSATRGVQIDHEAARALVELVGDERRGARDRGRQAHHLGGRRADRRARGRRARPCEGRNAAVRPDRRVGPARRRGVLAASERLVERSGDASRDVFLRIAGLLTNHVAACASARRSTAKASRRAAAAERLKRNRFYVQKLYEQARNYTPEELGQRRRPAGRARPGAEGRQQAAGRARVRARARSRSPAGRAGNERRELAEPEPETSRAACAFLRAAALRCSAPRAAALSIQRTSSRCSSAIRSWSPSSTAARRRRVKVLTVER